MPKPVVQKPNSKKVASVLDRIQPIGFDDDDGIKCLLYGSSKTGKTTTWSSFPAPILAIICSGGMKSGELRSINTPENRKRIKSVTIETTEELKEIIEEAAPDYATVVLDHVSGLQDYTLKEILGLEELPAQKSWGMATQGDYGTSTTMCKEYLRALLNLKGNVVIVGQERVNGLEESVDSDIIKPTIGVAVTPSLAGWLNPAVDYIFQTFKMPKTRKVKKIINGKEVFKEEKVPGEAEYCLRIGYHELYTTGFRSPNAKLPPYIVNPNYQTIMQIIKGEYKPVK
jgi:hypothetical protein